MIEKSKYAFFIRINQKEAKALSKVLTNTNKYVYEQAISLLDYIANSSIDYVTDFRTLPDCLRKLDTNILSPITMPKESCEIEPFIKTIKEFRYQYYRLSISCTYCDRNIDRKAFDILAENIKDFFVYDKTWYYFPNLDEIAVVIENLCCHILDLRTNATKNMDAITASIILIHKLASVQQKLLAYSSVRQEK